MRCLPFPTFGVVASRWVRALRANRSLAVSTYWIDGVDSITIFDHTKRISTSNDLMVGLGKRRARDVEKDQPCISSGDRAHMLLDFGWDSACQPFDHIYE